MSKKTKAVDEEEVDASENEEEVETKGSKKAEATVIDRNNAVIRVYTKALHGEKYLEYAKEFAGKVEGRKVV